MHHLVTSSSEHHRAADAAYTVSGMESGTSPRRLEKVRRLMSRVPVIGLLCALSSPSNGQRVAVGAMVGVNSASQEDMDSRLGFVGGVGVSLGLSQLISIRFEGLITQKGWEESSSILLHLTYLESPLLLVVGQHGGGLRPFVSVGIAPAFELSCRYVYPPPPGPPDTHVNHEPPDCTSRRTGKVDVGGVFAAGVEVDIGPARSALEGRYTHGLVNIDSESDWRTVSNRVASILVRVMLPLDRRPR
jgi:hypothetical protein